MRALTILEVDEVSGGSYLSDVTELATQTGLIGSIVGYAATWTTAGATTGGWWAAGFGAAWGGWLWIWFCNLRLLHPEINFKRQLLTSIKI